MTVSSTTNKISYSTGGGVTAFAYTFPILQTSDLTVILKNNTTLGESTLSITTHYAVSWDSVTRIGNVTTVATYGAGYTLIIKREVDLKQETDYTEGGAFPASSHEDALDKLTMIVQQLQEEVERCIIFSAGSGLSNFQIGAPEALKFLRWNNAATAIENADFVATTDVTINQGTKITMSGNITVTDHGNAWPYLMILDPNGAARNVTPGGAFRNFTQWFIDNIGTNDNITINAASYPYLGPGESGRFFYDGTYWQKSST